MFEWHKKWITVDRVIAFALIIAATFFYWEARRYPAGGSYFPVFSLVAIIVLSALMLIFSFRPQRSQADTKNAEKGKRNFRPLFLTGIFFLYLFIAPRLGLFASTALLIWSVMAFLKVRQIWLYVLVVLVVTAAFYIFFGLILKVSFPGTMLV